MIIDLGQFGAAKKQREPSAGVPAPEIVAQLRAQVAQLQAENAQLIKGNALLIEKIQRIKAAIAAAATRGQAQTGRAQNIGHDEPPVRSAPRVLIPEVMQDEDEDEDEPEEGAAPEPAKKDWWRDIGWEDDEEIDS